MSPHPVVPPLCCPESLVPSLSRFFSILFKWVILVSCLLDCGIRLFRRMLSKDLNVDPPPPPRDRPEVLNQPVGIPCPAMMTIATSRLSSKTTTPTHHLAAAHTPRPALPLSPPWLINFHMLCRSTPCWLLLRDSTSNRKSSLPKVIVSFSQNKVALVHFCIATSPLLRRWLWSFPGPLR